MNILITDWGELEQALPIALRYKVGLEVQEFAIPENLNRIETLLPQIQNAMDQLPLIGMHSPFAELVPASIDPMVRQVARTRIQQGYELAHKIGATHLVVHSGFFPKTYPREKWIRYSSDFWLDFLADKQDANFIHIENVYEDDYSALQALIDGINQDFQEERLTACLDIGHVNSNSSKSLEEWIRELGDRIRYVHLHNNDGILDDHWRLDKGKINIDEVLSLLQKYSPQAVWTVETYLEGIEPSLEWLRRRGYL